MMVIYILIHPKGEEVLFCQAHRSDILNSLFIWITQLGEWISIFALGAYLLIRNRKALLAGMISFVPIDLLMLWIKRILDHPRPLRYFEHGEISAIPDYPSLYLQSMPSGHTFTAFFIASFICFFFNLSLRYSLALILLAALIGISRIYLMCHFVEDILLGSILGIIAGILPTYIYPKLKFKNAG
jgi:membrane-associated phospholipid phosphatase